MVQPPPMPHISAAVKHLRGWITILAVIVAVCCVSQMLTYGFVKFTDIRFTEASKATPGAERPLQVVAPPDSAGDSGAAAVTGGVRSAAIERGREVPPERIPSNADSAMAKVNLFCTAAGVLGCAMLAVFTLLGTVIAGGGNIPGVERTVTASTWALVLGLLCLPWASAFPHLRVPGVFASYPELCAVADKAPGAASSTVAFFQWIVMPLTCATLSMLVLGMFRAGVERGIIATHPSHFDAAIQREMNDIARRGVVAPGAARTVGVLNRPLGAGSGQAPPGATIPPPAAAPMQVIPSAGAPSLEHAIDQAAAVAASLVRETGSVPGLGGRPVADRNFQRLI